jgi:hypothetical protein
VNRVTLKLKKKLNVFRKTERQTKRNETETSFAAREPDWPSTRNETETEPREVLPTGWTRSKQDHGVGTNFGLLVPSRFSSVVLPIFGSTTDKFCELYPRR